MTVFIRIALAVSALALTFGSAQKASALSKDAQMLIGTYVSNGATFKVEAVGNSLILRTNAELSKQDGCRTRLSRPLGQRDAAGFAEVYYQLDTRGCPGLDGRVTLHYNETLFGTPVYMIDVIIHHNTMPMNPRGITNGLSLRWSLDKVSGR